MNRKQIAEFDPEKFEQNKCTLHGRRLVAIDEYLQIDFWIDKHYHSRDQSGQRENISPDLVQEIVTLAFKPLLYFSALIKGFTFLNFEPRPRNPHRVILQKFINGTALNVVIEGHFTSVDCFEITVKTAMWIEDFRISDGQFLVELADGETILKKFEKPVMRDLAKI